MARALTISTAEVGFMALVVNAVVVVAVGLVTRAPAAEHIATGIPEVSTVDKEALTR